MNVTIDLGNIWDALSGIGTVSAVVLSLWLVRKENKTHVNILRGSRIQVFQDQSRLVTGSNMDRIIQVRAYNSGFRSIGISFLGFGVGKKEKAFIYKIFKRKKISVLTYVKYLDSVYETPELELLKSGETTKTHEIEWRYLYQSGSKYWDVNKNLLVYAIFEDFNGKQYVQEMVLENPNKEG